MIPLSCDTMELRTETYSDELLYQARQYFLQQGRSDFLSKTPHSLCARYLLTQIFHHLGFEGFIPADGVFTCGKYFFSTSHSGDQIMIAVAETKVAIDVEKIIPRDESLLL